MSSLSSKGVLRLVNGGEVGGEPKSLVPLVGGAADVAERKELLLRVAALDHGRVLVGEAALVDEGVADELVDDLCVLGGAVVEVGVVGGLERELGCCTALKATSKQDGRVLAVAEGGLVGAVNVGYELTLSRRVDVDAAEVALEAEGRVEDVSACRVLLAVGKRGLGGAAINDGLVCVGEAAAVDEVVASELHDDLAVQSRLNEEEDI